MPSPANFEQWKLSIMSTIGLLYLVLEAIRGILERCQKICRCAVKLKGEFGRKDKA